MKQILVLASILAFCEGERTHCESDTINPIDDESADEIVRMGRGRYTDPKDDPTKDKRYTADADDVRAAKKRAADAAAIRKAAAAVTGTAGGPAGAPAGSSAPAGTGAQA